MFALLAYLGPHPSFSFAFLPHLFKEGDKNTLEQTKKHTALTSVYTYGHVCIYAYIVILYFFIIIIILSLLFLLLLYIFIIIIYNLGSLKCLDARSN